MDSGAEAGLEDGRDDGFATADKADGFTVTREELAAILQVANTASVATLRGDVTLTKRTAENIVAVRSTAPFATLAALDAVPYVGPVALDKLLAYVHARGLVQAPTPRVWRSRDAGFGGAAGMGFASHGALVLGASTCIQLATRGEDGVATTWLQRENTYDCFLQPQFGIAEDGQQHFFYKDVATAGFRHVSTGYPLATYPELPFDDLIVNQGTGGPLYGLAGRRATNPWGAGVSLVAFQPDGSYWDYGLPRGATLLDRMHLAVDAQRVPTVTYLAPGDGVHVARLVGETFVDERVVSTLSSGLVASAGTTAPVVFVAYPNDSLRVFRRNTSGFAQVATLPLGPIAALDAAIDGDGTVHACYVSNQRLYDVRIGDTNTVTTEDLGQGNACHMETGPDGRLHIITWGGEGGDERRHLTYH